jgi:hypothetical protein
MTVLRNALLLSCVVCYARWDIAQQSLRLSVTETVTIPEQRSSGISVVSPVKCAPDGELYAEFVGDSDPGIVAIAGDGQHITRFSLAQLPDFGVANIIDFAVFENHNVVLLASKQEKPTSAFEFYAILLKSDGSSSITKIAITPASAATQNRPFVATFKSGH